LKFLWLEADTVDDDIVEVRDLLKEIAGSISSNDEAFDKLEKSTAEGFRVIAVENAVYHERLDTHLVDYRRRMTAVEAAQGGNKKKWAAVGGVGVVIGAIANFFKGE
jgi:hypothetical protein